MNRCIMRVVCMREIVREIKLQTLGHGARHHELPEKQDPSIPRFHHHRPNQSFSPPSKHIEMQTQEHVSETQFITIHF